MMAAAVVLLSVGIVSLAVVCMNLTRRIAGIEKAFLEAAELLGEPLYE